MQPITTSNWGYAPHNRWAFRHVQQLFPTCRLASDPAAYRALPNAPRDLLGLLVRTADGKSITVLDMLRTSDTDAFAVLHRGQVVTEYFDLGMGPNDLHLLNSVTKSFVGMLAGIAVHRGLLDVNAPIRDYLPDFDSSGWAGTTVRHLLDMTAGVRYGEDYDDPNADFWHETSVVGWRPALVDARTPSTLRDYARALQGKDQVDGSTFHYRTVDTCVLGMVLQAVFEQPLQHALEARLWAPLCTRQNAVIVVDRAHFPYVGAGMNTCIEDLLRFGAMLVNGGRVDGVQVVPEAWIDDTLNGNAEVRAQFAASTYTNLVGWHYRNQVWVRGGERPVMFALGIHGQMIYMDRSRDLVIAKFSSQPRPVDAPLWQETMAVLDAIGEYLDA